MSKVIVTYVEGSTLTLEDEESEGTLTLTAGDPLKAEALFGNLVELLLHGTIDDVEVRRVSPE